MASNYRDEAFWIEFLRPGLDRGSDGVGFEELVFGFDGGEVVVVGRMGKKGIVGVGGGRGGGGEKTGGGDWVEDLSTCKSALN